jgi:glutamate-1-semialdehyde aminotransferase
MGYYEDYVARTPECAKAAQRAQRLIPGGVGSAIQFWPPYPIYVKGR